MRSAGTREAAGPVLDALVALGLLRRDRAGSLLEFAPWRVVVLRPCEAELPRRPHGTVEQTTIQLVVAPPIFLFRAVIAIPLRVEAFSSE